VLRKESKFKQTEPFRSRLARRLVRSYNLPRGKDRLFLILHSALGLPSSVIIEYFMGARIILDLEDYLQRWIYCHRIEDDPDYYLISKILRAGEHFVDVGANIGIVTLIASKVVGEHGKVYAIEALPSTRDQLIQNLSLNSTKNVVVVPFALLDQNRDANFYASEDGNIGGSSLSSSGNKARPVMVEGRTFNSLLADGTIERCDVLKIDIEGAEVLALNGMGSLFERSKPRAVMIEISDVLLAQFSSTPAEIINFFLVHGYEWFKATQNGFKRLRELEIKGFNNLWAILPGGVSEEFLI
jgi:FkbM family methyltransferase